MGKGKNGEGGRMAALGSGVLWLLAAAVAAALFYVHFRTIALSVQARGWDQRPATVLQWREVQNRGRFMPRPRLSSCEPFCLTSRSDLLVTYEIQDGSSMRQVQDARPGWAWTFMHGDLAAAREIVRQAAATRVQVHAWVDPRDPSRSTLSPHYPLGFGALLSVFLLVPGALLTWPLVRGGGWLARRMGLRMDDDREVGAMMILHGLIPLSVLAFADWTALRFWPTLLLLAMTALAPAGLWLLRRARVPRELAWPEHLRLDAQRRPRIVPAAPGSRRAAPRASPPPSP